MNPYGCRTLVEQPPHHAPVGVEDAEDDRTDTRAGSVSPIGWSPAIVALEGMIRIETPSTRNWSVPPKGESSRSGARI